MIPEKEVEGTERYASVFTILALSEPLHPKISLQDLVMKIEKENKAHSPKLMIRTTLSRMYYPFGLGRRMKLGKVRYNLIQRSTPP